MRIIVCTKRDLIGGLVLNALLPELAGCTVTVLLSDKTRPTEQTVPDLAEMKYLERDLPINTVFPLVDSLGGPGGKLATLAGLSRRFSVAVEVVDDINAPEAVAMVQAFRPDVILSIRFSHIFQAAVFDLPRFGTYNIHPGALPQYAGLFAAFRCMLDGQDRIGCTLHRVDAGIDTGPVVGIGWLPVQPERSLLWHVANAYAPGLELFYEMLAILRRGGTIHERGQDRSARRYGSLPDAQAFARFRAAGFRLYQPEEYAELLGGFLPTGLALSNEMGEPCCFARA